MSENKVYDLENRTEKFSLAVRNFCLKLKADLFNRVYIQQVLRSAGSVAANYIEANDNLGDKDLKHKIRICKKESKETKLWMKHLLIYDQIELENERQALIRESDELMRIFAAILRKLNS
ncbi:four helix bundle protein [Niabella beijingensis]|uniref:four helix bundle protein n=1 Tax=Niabella beijingensis TaxID=2872700 RepID=UPI001CBBD05A|nr:four helix bundle protein [Niabella beijingensis]MBZ4191686.1 four helix bundle protein [Niabella beijingensis]